MIFSTDSDHWQSLPEPKKGITVPKCEPLYPELMAKLRRTSSWWLRDTADEAVENGDFGTAALLYRVLDERRGPWTGGSQ